VTAHLAGSPMTESDIERLEATRRDAMLAGDVDALAALLADDLIWIHASSKTDSKASFLQGFRDGALACFRLDYTPALTRLFAGGGMVTGTVEMEVAVDGARRSQISRYTCLWTDQGEGARLALCQSTRLPQDT
jgi:ketosteroid isomerase-like protein